MNLFDHLILNKNNTYTGNTRSIRYPEISYMLHYCHIHLIMHFSIEFSSVRLFPNYISLSLMPLQTLQRIFYIMHIRKAELIIHARIISREKYKYHSISRKRAQIQKNVREYTHGMRIRLMTRPKVINSKDSLPQKINKSPSAIQIKSITPSN